MDLPKDNNQLDQIFINGSEPSIEEFEGEYWVAMLTGKIPNFRWAGHKKRFSDEDVDKTGKNIILSGITFGHFNVEPGRCDDLDDLQAVILNYGNNKNLLTRSVRDKIRTIENGWYLGRYYSDIDNSLQFRGYFSLERK